MLFRSPDGVAPPPPVVVQPSATLPAFQSLTPSATVADRSFFIMQRFAQGAVPEGSYPTLTGATNSSHYVENRHPDGSMCDVLFVGRRDGVAGQAGNLTFGVTTTPPAAAPDLTEAALIAAVNANAKAQDVVVTFSEGFDAVVRLSDLLGVDAFANGLNGRAEVVRTTPHLYCARYSVAPGGHARIRLTIYAEVHSDGKVFAFVRGTNGYAFKAGAAHQVYKVVVQIGSAPAFAPARFDTPPAGVAAKSHENWTFWHHFAWADGLEWTPRHDTAYYQAQGFVPAHELSAPGETALNSVPKTNIPFATGWFKGGDMGSTGADSTHSVFAKHDILYWMNGDARGYQGTIAAAARSGQYPFFFLEEATLRLPRPSQYPNLENSSDFPSHFTGRMSSASYSRSISLPHCPGVGTSAYMATGMPGFRDIALAMATYQFFTASLNQRANGKGRLNPFWTSFETRGCGW